MFGKPLGERPESYWQPFLGDWFSLRPSDIGEMTPVQLMGCVQYTEKK